MTSPSHRHRRSPDADQNSLLQRREIVMMLTCDDMSTRLKHLAGAGHHRDFLALSQELGDWRFHGQETLEPILYIPVERRH